MEQPSTTASLTDAQLNPPEGAVIDLQRFRVAAEPAPVGRLVAFMGSKGGCGVTLLVVNLAAELASGSRVCVVDLAGSHGDVAAYLDLQCERELSELIEFEHIDAGLLEAVATKHRSGVAVLPQPTDLAETALLDSDAVGRVLEASRLAYDIVLVDCDARLDEATLTTAMSADIVALVFTPDVPAVRDANRELRLLDRLGVDRDRVRLVLNQGSRRQQLSVAQIQDQLGREVAAVVRADRSACARCHLTGQLLRELPGRHLIDEDICRLWPALVGAPEQDQPKRRRLASWLHTLLNVEVT